MTTYAVFTVRFGEEPASHHGIFVQTNEDGCGTLFDVRGAIGANGSLVFSCSDERLTRFASTDPKGVIQKDNLGELERICRSVAAPKSQYLARSETGYVVPACRCGEWTSKAWEAVDASGLVKARGSARDGDLLPEVLEKAFEKDQNEKKGAGVREFTEKHEAF